MSFINSDASEINFKVVYYGPGLSGKTSSMQHIYTNTPSDLKGRMISLATETDRFLFFDFISDGFPKTEGLRPRFHLYTVPGPVFYNNSRRLILKGVDGIIFVADSQLERMEANHESMAGLESDLATHGYELNNVPLVIQYAKRDLPNALDIETLEAELNPFRVPSFPAVSMTGEGVFESFESCARQILTKNEPGGLFESCTRQMTAKNEPGGLFNANKTALDVYYLSLQKSQEQMTFEERFALLHTILEQPASRGNWMVLCAFMDLWPNDNTLADAVEYAKQHIRDWPTKLKRLTGKWLFDHETYRSDERLRLVEHVDIMYFSDRKRPVRAYQAWLEAEPLRDVKILRLYDETFRDKDVKSFVDGPIAQSPVELGLGAKISRRGVAMLAESPKLRSVRILDLNRNRVGFRGLRTLLQSPHLKHLKALHLGRNRLSYNHMSLFTEEIAIEALERLDLDHNKLGPEAIRVLANATMLSTLQELNLSHNAIKKGGCDALADCEQLLHLEVLYLHDCQLNDDDVAKLIQAPQFARLKNLALSGNQLTLKSVELLANSPHLSQLEELDICANRFSENEANELLHASPYLKNVKRFCY